MTIQIDKQFISSTNTDGKVNLLMVFDVGRDDEDESRPSSQRETRPAQIGKNLIWERGKFASANKVDVYRSGCVRDLGESAAHQNSAAMSHRKQHSTYSARNPPSIESEQTRIENLQPADMQVTMKVQYLSQAESSRLATSPHITEVSRQYSIQPAQCFHRHS
jgi:hypothetical protein